MPIQAKVFIKGQIVAETGLHIGGSKGAIQVGELDNPVIKTSEGLPYIPGSSLKGKLRSQLESSVSFTPEQVDHRTGICKDITHYISKIFGAGSINREMTPTRLIVRDAFLRLEYRKTEYTESKHENVMNRKTGTTVAGGLREMERVIAGSIFDFEMVYTIFDAKDVENLKYLHASMKQLEDSYLGGSGSRGSGKVKFAEIQLSLKTSKMYEQDQASPIDLGKFSNINFAFPYEEIKKHIK